MLSAFSKTEMSRTSFVPTRHSDTANKRFRISPAAQKQMNWEVNCALRENYSSWVSGSLSYRVHARGTMSPSWRQKLQLRFEAALVLPHTHTHTKLSHLILAAPWISMLLLFWTQSTKQTVKYVHAWLCSTWPTLYTHFNGIMNTQYKGIVHDSKLFCTMVDLCHWFCSFERLYFWSCLKPVQRVTLTPAWIIWVIKTETVLTPVWKKTHQLHRVKYSGYIFFAFWELVSMSKLLRHHHQILNVVAHLKTYFFN